MHDNAKKWLDDKLLLQLVVDFFCIFVLREFFKSPTTPTNNHEKDQLVVNLEDPTLESNNLIGPSQTLKNCMIS
jgi:hypothetical protein